MDASNNILNTNYREQIIANQANDPVAVEHNNLLAALMDGETGSSSSTESAEEAEEAATDEAAAESEYTEEQIEAMEEILEDHQIWEDEAEQLAELGLTVQDALDYSAGISSSDSSGDAVGDTGEDDQDPLVEDDPGADGMDDAVDTDDNGLDINGLDIEESLPGITTRSESLQGVDIDTSQFVIDETGVLEGMDAIDIGTDITGAMGEIDTTDGRSAGTDELLGGLGAVEELNGLDEVVSQTELGVDLGAVEALDITGLNGAVSDTNLNVDLGSSIDTSGITGINSGIAELGLSSGLADTDTASLENLDISTNLSTRNYSSNMTNMFR